MTYKVLRDRYDGLGNKVYITCFTGVKTKKVANNYARFLKDLDLAANYTQYAYTVVKD